MQRGRSHLVHISCVYFWHTLQRLRFENSTIDGQWLIWSYRTSSGALFLWTARFFCMLLLGLFIRHFNWVTRWPPTSTFFRVYAFPIIFGITGNQYFANWRAEGQKITPNFSGSSKMFTVALVQNPALHDTWVQNPEENQSVPLHRIMINFIQRHEHIKISTTHRFVVLTDKIWAVYSIIFLAFLSHLVTSVTGIKKYPCISERGQTSEYDMVL